MAIRGAHGGFTIVQGLGAARISGLGELLGRWLPAPIESAGLFATDSVINFHLDWTALPTLGLGVVVRARGWPRLLGLLPLLYAIVDHDANNYFVVRPATGGVAGWLLSAMDTMRDLLPLLLFLAVIAAVVMDRVSLRAARIARPDLLLAAERPGYAGWTTLGRFAAVKPPLDRAGGDALRPRPTVCLVRSHSE